MPFSAHASACAILAFADGGSRNSSLHPPQEALGISTRRGSGRFFSTPRAPDRQRRLRAGRGYYFNAAARGAHTFRRQSRGWSGACLRKQTTPLPSPFPAAFPAALPHFYTLFPPPCISYHTKMQIYDDILCPASFFCGGAADRRPPTADCRPPNAERRTPTADRKKALPFREAPFGTIQLHQPGGQVMSRPAST